MYYAKARPMLYCTILWLFCCHTITILSLYFHYAILEAALDESVRQLSGLDSWAVQTSRSFSDIETLLMAAWPGVSSWIRKGPKTCIKHGTPVWPMVAGLYASTLNSWAGQLRQGPCSAQVPSPWTFMQARWHMHTHEIREDIDLHAFMRML